MNLEQYEERIRNLESILLSSTYSLCFVMGFSEPVHLQMDKETKEVTYCEPFDVQSMDHFIWAEILFEEIANDPDRQLNPFEQFIFNETFGSMEKFTDYMKAEKQTTMERQEALKESAAEERARHQDIQPNIEQTMTMPAVMDDPEEKKEAEAMLIRERADREWSDDWRESW